MIQIVFEIFTKTTKMPINVCNFFLTLKKYPHFVRFLIGRAAAVNRAFVSAAPPYKTSHFDEAQASPVFTKS